MTITLSSSSTLDDVFSVYMDNAGYSINQSVTEAQQFALACRYLILLNPQRVKRENEEIEIDTVRIKEQLDEALRYMSLNRTDGTGGRTVLADLSDFRD